jgi:hypothetical protein
MWPRTVKVKNLAIRMNACIGSSGPDRSYDLTKNFPKSMLDSILNRQPIGLLLPSGKVRTIIGTKTSPPPRFSR